MKESCILRLARDCVPVCDVSRSSSTSWLDEVSEGEAGAVFGSVASKASLPPMDGEVSVFGLACIILIVKKREGPNELGITVSGTIDRLI